jgi:GNAT superfamily N-acetyltransferase
MQFLPLTDSDWNLFLEWATDEGWKVSFQEQRLFQNQWRSHFYVLHADGGVRGFVSAVIYRSSGWIGNLLVGSEYRGYGYGSSLFDFALDLLRDSGLQRIWLTASEAGLPVYRRRGFVTVDRVERWCGRGQGRLELGHDNNPAELIACDRDCWGESRAPLLSLLADDADVCRTGETQALLQTSVADWQLGPWLSINKCPRENRMVLQEALAKTVAGRDLLADVLVSAEMELVLRQTGFRKIASNELMCLAQQPVSLNGVVALASLGSIG